MLRHSIDTLTIIQTIISAVVLIGLIVLSLPYKTKSKKHSRKKQDVEPKEETKPTTPPPTPQTTAQKLEAYMESAAQPWRDPKINLSILTKALNINRNKLTQTIQEMGYANFYDFIAHHRIREFCRMVEHGEQIFIKNIHTEIGFHSRSVAFSQFKKHLGTTPGEYIKKQQNTPKANKQKFAKENRPETKPRREKK